MSSTYKRLGNYIQLVDERNTSLEELTLVGLSITKEFIPSVANIIGTDLSKYKVIYEGQFACSLMQVSRDGKMPIAMFTNEKAIMSPAYPIFEVTKKDILLPEYLMMWFSRSEFDRQAAYYAVGGVRGNLQWDDFCDLTLPIPSIEKQRAFVAEYNTVQNRIQLNEQLIQKLEETAQTIYRRWFVEFEFPVIKEDGTLSEVETYMSSGGKMVWSEELEKDVPEGWSIGSFSNIAIQFSGYSFKGNEYSFHDGITVVRGENVTENGFRWDTHKKWNKELPERASDCYLQEYDVIVGMDGSKVGKNWGIIGKYQLPLLLAQRVTCLRGKKDYYQSFIYLSFFDRRFEEYVNQVHTGTSVPHISGKQILEFPIVIPEDSLCKSFHMKIEKLIDGMHHRLSESDYLIKVKDLLLSKMTKVGETAEKQSL